MSLGQYLSQLKPGNEDTPDFLKKELSLEYIDQGAW